MHKTRNLENTLNPIIPISPLPLYYPPYGSALPGLQFNYADDGDTSRYRFGFNNQERDDEIAGVGNIYSAEFWEYDARLGRRFNTDPVFKEYESVYACLGNNPIWIIDINGADSTLYISVDKNVTIDKSKFEIQLKKSLKRAGLEFLKIKFTEIEDVVQNPVKLTPCFPRKLTP